MVKNKDFEYYHSLIDIQELLFTCQETLGEVPKQLLKKIERLVGKDMDRNVLPLPRAIEIVDFLMPYI